MGGYSGETTRSLCFYGTVHVASGTYATYLDDIEVYGR
jgi:hypothetical protein